MIYSGQVSIAQLVGLLFRHRKWHCAEYNRIASGDQLQSELAPEALAQHYGAFMAIEARVSSGTCGAGMAYPSFPAGSPGRVPRG